MSVESTPRAQRRVAWFAFGYVVGVCTHGLMHVIVHLVYEHWPHWRSATTP